MSTNPLNQSLAGQQQPPEQLDQPQEGAQQQQPPDRWDFEHLDPNYGQPGYAFSEPGWLNHHKWVIANHGLETVRCIADEPDKYDNQVWIVKDLETEQHYAMKVCSLHYYRRDLFDDSLDAMYKETDTLRQLNHQNIIIFFETFELEDPDTGFPYGFLCSLLELMDGHLLKLQGEYPNQVFPEDRAKDWFLQIATAVDFLHNDMEDKWLVHLAIRPVNILYRKVNAELDQYVFKLTDFEESLIFGKDDEDKMPDWNGYRTNGWTAPEMRWEAGHGKPTKPMDIYSLGQTLLTSLLTNTRQKHVNYFRVLSRAISIETLDPAERDIIEVLSDAVGTLLLRCVNREAGQRPTIQEVLTSRWLWDN